MADTIKKEISTKTDSQEPKPTAKKSKGKSFATVIIVAVIVLICLTLGGAGGFYLWQQQQNDLKNQQTVNSQLQQNFQNLNSSIAQLGNKFSSSNQAIDELKNKQDELKNNQIEFAEIAQNAITISSRGQREWILAEIDYLLRIAHRRLQIGNDINSAIAALTAADERIYDLGDLRFFPIRVQLKKDIANLKTLHQVDVNGTAMTIDQLLEHLSSLPFKTVNEEIKSKLDEPEEVLPAEKSNGFVDSVIDTVMNIGDIKIHHRSLEPVSSATRQQQVEQTLRSYLLAVRLSVLRYDQTLFAHNLKQSQSILLQYYNLSDNRVAQMQKDLDEFSQLNLSPVLPDINASWTMLQDAVNKLDIPKVKKPQIKKPSDNKSHTTQPESETKKAQPAKVEVL